MNSNLLYGENLYVRVSPTEPPLLFLGIESHPTFRHTLDIKEFLSFTIPRQVVFFELGFDLASSNSAQTMDKLEKSLYGVMLVNTPRAFLHLLNRDLFLVTFIANHFFISKIQRGLEKPCGSDYLTKFVFLEIIFDLKN